MGDRTIKLSRQEYKLIRIYRRLTKHNEKRIITTAQATLLHQYQALHFF